MGMKKVYHSKWFPRLFYSKPIHDYMCSLGFVSEETEYYILNQEDIYGGKSQKIEIILFGLYCFGDREEVDITYLVDKNKSAYYFKKFIISLILSLPLFYFMLLDFWSWLPGTNVLPPYIGLISLLLTIPVQFVIGAIFYKGFWASLRMKTFNMDSLVAIGTSAAFLYSLFNLIWYFSRTGSLIGLGGKIPDLYFETAAFLVTFVILGKWLEAQAKRKS